MYHFVRCVVFLLISYSFCHSVSILADEEHRFIKKKEIEEIKEGATLKKFKNLEKLNGLKDLEKLAALKELEKLEKLGEISELEALKELEKLNDLDEIKEIKKIKKRKFITKKNNVSVDSEKRIDIEQAFKHLKPIERAVLTMNYTEELSHEDISKVLEIPLGTVKTNISRGKNRLQKVLSEYH